MSIANFIPTVWAEGYLREKERAHVFVGDCTRKYEGQLKKLGDEVVIPSLGDMTIHDIALGDKNKKIEDPEVLVDTSIRVKADKISYFNFMVDDIDAALAKGDLMDIAQHKSAFKLANKQDIYVADLAADKNAPKLFKNPMKVVEGVAGEGEVNVLRLIDLGAQRLHENDVPESEQIIVTIPYRLRTLIKSEYLDKDTNNSEMMKNGTVGKYGNVIIRVSNNVHNAGTADAPVDKIMFRTADAIAFVEQICEIEAYRPEGYFSDAIKGFTLYGGKIIQPKSLVVADITY